MRVTCSELRKNLFRIVDRALAGTLVEITCKGQVLRLVPVRQTSKMERLITRDTIAGTPEDLEEAQKELDEEARALWEKKWSKL